MQSLGHRDTVIYFFLYLVVTQLSSQPVFVSQINAILYISKFDNSKLIFIHFAD